MNTPRVDKTLEMRRHDANHPERWQTEDVMPIIQLARVMERELQRVQTLTRKCDCGHRMVIMCPLHLVLFIALGVLVGALMMLI